MHFGLTNVLNEKQLHCVEPSQVLAGGGTQI